MPAKKRAPQATPESCHRSAPLDKATDEAYNALLPWLAMGYGPFKSGVSKQSGIRALWRSVRDAREEMKAPGERIRHPTQTQFVAWMDSEQYKIKIDKVVKRPEYKDHTIAQREEHREALLQVDDLSAEQIIQLLEVANGELGTEFVVGFITQGFRCQFDKATKTWNHEFVTNTSIQLDTGLPRANLRPGEEPNPAPPIIWMWNDDADNREHHRDMSGEESDFYVQWEGFGLDKKGDAERRQVVQDWNLGSRVRADVKTGVWMVTKNNSNTDEPGKNYLDVQAGHFVRDTPPPNFGQAPGCRYVKACNNIDKGNVPEANLRKIKLHGSAPTPGPKDEDEVVAKTPETELKTEIKPDVKPEPKLNSPPAKRTNFRGVKTPFQIYRAVQATDKIGGEADNDDFDVDHFRVQNGEFLLDLGDKGVGGIPWVRRIKNIGGAMGQVASRRLQPLIEAPWGLPDLLPVLPTIEVSEQSTAAELKKAIVSRGLSIEGDHQDTLKRIRTWEDENMTTVRLEQLNKPYQADADSTHDFFKDEIVRSIPGTDCDKTQTVEVWDYQCKKRRVKQVDLTPVGLETDSWAGIPFGLRLDPHQLPEQFGGRPRDVDTNPASKAEDTVEKKEDIDAGIYGRNRSSIKRRLNLSEFEKPKNARSKKGTIRPAKRVKKGADHAPY